VNLERELARHALEHHPGRAATVLERLDESEAIRLLGSGPVASAAAVLVSLSPQYGTAVLGRVKPERAARILDALPVDTAARLLRRAATDVQTALLTHIDPKHASSIRAVLRFPEGSAGALMDPDVLALPSELTAREAMERVRKGAELARYNLYVVDQAQHLVGVLNLRELLLARRSTPLTDLMTRDPHRVVATADRASVLANPGWKAVHALPVVDEAGVFLGAIRYRVLRHLEEELLAARTDDFDTSAALGQVVAESARGLLDALSGAADLELGRRGRGSDEER
jgi:magnesium transporter